MKRRGLLRKVAYISFGIVVLGATLAVGLWIGYSNVHTCVCGCITRVQ